MECDICLIEWDTTEHIPRILSCGHTICQECLILILNKSKDQSVIFSCPSCVTPHPDIKDESDIKQLIKNICLIRIVEKLDTRKSMMYQSVLTSSREVKTTKEDQTPRSSLTSSTINRSKKESAKIKIGITRQEIERLEDFFVSYKDEFGKTNTQKVEDTFSCIKNLVHFHYNSAMNMIRQCKKEQDAQIDTKLNEISLLKEELDEIERMLLQEEEVTEEPYEDVIERVSNLLNYDLELFLFQINTNVNEEVKDRLSTIVEQAFTVDLDFTKVDGQFPLIRDILQKDSLWQCPCGEIENEVGEVLCTSCTAFRKVESYENVLYNQDMMTKLELEDLKKRRKLEREKFQTLKKSLCSSTQNDTPYALDMNWFLTWKAYICSNDKSVMSLIPPCVIPNENLLNEDKSGLKEGLRKNVDYIKVNKDIWEFFKLNYSGMEVVITTLESRSTNDEGCLIKKSSNGSYLNIDMDLNQIC